MPQPSEALSFIRWCPDPVDSIPDRPAAARAEGPTTIRLFWDDPPWYYVDRATADFVAQETASLGIAVSGLSREWSNEDHASQFLTASHGPRVLPYRNERFGFGPDDLKRCHIVDVRLDRATRRDGGDGYDASDLIRWETGIESDVHASFGIPPELQSVQQLGLKVDQLRSLVGPTASIFGSTGSPHDPGRFGDLAKSGWDGWILRIDRDDVPGGDWINRLIVWKKALRSADKQIRLWVVPPPLETSDLAKLFALGVEAVACDSFCDSLLWPTESGTRPTRDEIRQRLRNDVAPKVASVMAGLNRQCGHWTVDPKRR